MGQTVGEASFQEKHTHGLVRWWNLELKDRTPEWAEKVTALPKEQILRVARGCAQAAPHCISWLGPGVGMQPRSAYAAMAVSALNGLAGSIDHEGGVMWEAKVPSGGSPKLDAYQDDVAKAGVKHKKINQRGTKEFPAMASGRPGSGVVTTRVADAMLAADPYNVKLIIAYWNNFNFSAQETRRWDQAMARLSFFAHIGTHASEMTQFADIVLPAPHHATELLAYMKSKAGRHAYLTLNQPVVEPLWDVRQEETEFVWLLAENHCTDAACVEVCPTTPKAMHKHANGVTAHNQERCIGCQLCQEACPYSAQDVVKERAAYSVLSFSAEEPHGRYRDATPALAGISASGAEVARKAGATPPYRTQFTHSDYRDVRRKAVVEKCNFCEHRVLNGEQPYCVVSCPAGARIFGDLQDPGSEVSTLLKRYPSARLKNSKGQMLKTGEAGTRPNVHYIRSYRPSARPA